MSNNALEEVKKAIIATYGKDNLNKVITNQQQGPIEGKKRFLKKYPYAKINKFTFDVDLNSNGDISKYNVWYKIDETTSYDITSNTFKNNRDYRKDLFWKEFWEDSGTVQDFEKNEKGLGNQHINAMWLYINNSGKLKFPCRFKKLEIPAPRDGANVNDYKQNKYLASLYAAYITTYLCGVSTYHFKNYNDVPRMITSLLKYHLYFHMARFLKNPSLMDQYITKDITKIILDNKPKKYIWERNKFTDSKAQKSVWLNSQPESIRGKIHNVRYARNSAGNISGIHYDLITGEQIHDLENDYKLFIAEKTNGFTKLGAKLLQESIESFVYSVLGAQARTRWTIVGVGAKSSQTQDVFKQIVQDTIVQSDTTVTIANMRQAIKDTNVVLNMVVCPGVILIPSKLIILKEKIPGYNNVLTVGKKTMLFGKNNQVNYNAKLAKSESASTSETKTTPTTVTNTPTINPTPRPNKLETTPSTPTNQVVSSSTRQVVSTASTPQTEKYVSKEIPNYAEDIYYASAIMLATGGLIAKFVI